MGTQLSKQVERANCSSHASQAAMPSMGLQSGASGMYLSFDSRTGPAVVEVVIRLSFFSTICAHNISSKGSLSYLHRLIMVHSKQHVAIQLAKGRKL